MVRAAQGSPTLVTPDGQRVMVDVNAVAAVAAVAAVPVGVHPGPVDI